MTTNGLPGGTFAMAEGLTVTRMGYGAMQLAGPGVFGPPRDRAEAVAVLREAVALGITHIDTSDYYGPFVTNEIIKEALHPYPEELHIVTKVGAVRDARGRLAARARAAAAARSGARQPAQPRPRRARRRQPAPRRVRLGRARLARGAVAALAELQQEGLDQASRPQHRLGRADRRGALDRPVVCVQNLYNIANRRDDELIDSLAERGHRLRAVLPARRLQPAAVRRAGVGRRAPGRDAAGGGARLAAAALAQHPADPRHLLGRRTCARTSHGAGLPLPGDALAELDAIAS